MRKPLSNALLPTASLAAAGLFLSMAGCAVGPSMTASVAVHTAPVFIDTLPISVAVEAPVGAPAPIAAPWAPSPLLVEVPPPMPYGGAVWIGGY